MWVVRWGGDRLCQTSPIPRSPDGDKKVDDRKTSSAEKLECVQTCMIMQSQSKAILIWDESMKLLLGYHIR